MRLLSACHHCQRWEQERGEGGFKGSWVWSACDYRTKGHTLHLVQDNSGADGEADFELPRMSSKASEVTPSRLCMDFAK